MERETQRALAARFRALHEGPRILILPNAWDASSARIFEKAGFPAVATTSAGVCFSLGSPDGEQIGREKMLDVVSRIVSAVSLPVTADMLAGFGKTAKDVAQTAEAVIAAGAVGLNIEDREDGILADIARQTEKIQAIRSASTTAGVPLVINARTDVYLLEIGDPGDRFEHAVRRANAYRKAGADCLFVPGVRDPELIRRLTAAIDGPVNILAVSGAPPVAELERLGVRRVSVGSGAMRATLALVTRVARELKEHGTYAAFSEALPGAEVNQMFKDQK